MILKIKCINIIIIISNRYEYQHELEDEDENDFIEFDNYLCEILMLLHNNDFKRKNDINELDDLMKELEKRKNDCFSIKEKENYLKKNLNQYPFYQSKDTVEELLKNGKDTYDLTKYTEKINLRYKNFKNFIYNYKESRENKINDIKYLIENKKIPKEKIEKAKEYIQDEKYYGLDVYNNFLSDLHLSFLIPV